MGKPEIQAKEIIGLFKDAQSLAESADLSDYIGDAAADTIALLLSACTDLVDGEPQDALRQIGKALENFPEVE